MTLYWPEERLAFEFEDQPKEARQHFPPDVLVILVGSEQVESPAFMEEVRRLVASRGGIGHEGAGRDARTCDEAASDEERFAERLAEEELCHCDDFPRAGERPADDKGDCRFRSSGLDDGWPLFVDPFSCAWSTAPWTSMDPLEQPDLAGHGLRLDSPLIQIVVHNCEEMIVEH